MRPCRRNDFLPPRYNEPRAGANSTGVKDFLKFIVKQKTAGTPKGDRPVFTANA
jgi:hypothetical protein